MAKGVVVISVPHTGTMFTVNLFKRLGYDDLGLNREPVDRDCVYKGHMLKPTQINDALAKHRKGMALVVPLRHPYVTEVSWLSRVKDQSDLLPGFRNLFNIFRPLNPYWMPVDSPRRDDYLERLREVAPVTTDWTPEHVYYDNHSKRWQDCEPSKPVRDLVESMQPFLEQFYE